MTDSCYWQREFIASEKERNELKAKLADLQRENKQLYALLFKVTGLTSGKKKEGLFDCG